MALCVLRWNAWFGNLPEEAYSVGREPHNVVITFGEDALHERTISWRCDTVIQPSYAIYWNNNIRDTILAVGRLVESRAGKAAFYHVRLRHLTAGDYCVELHSGLRSSAVMRMSVSNPEQLNEFVLAGDIQDLKGDFSQHLFSATDSMFPNAAFFAQAGDLIERPMDTYWQMFFNAYGHQTNLFPFVAATGNHEYLKGVYKQLDNRWTSIFVNPENGPKRATGRTYYIDFPKMRFVVIDTDQLQLFSDYTRANTWLKRILNDEKAADKWKIVMMHHSVYSAGMGRNNPLIAAALSGALRQADAVFAGHDHNYARRIVWDTDHKADYINVVTTSSEKSYLGRLNPKDDRLLTAHPVVEHIRLNDTTLTIETWRVDDYSLYDCVVLHKDGVADDYYESEKEILPMPERYIGVDNSKTRKFLERRTERGSYE